MRKKALPLVPPEKREYQGVTIQVKKGDLPRIKKRIHSFMDRIIQDFEAEPGEEVIQFNIQMHQLSRE